MTHPRMTVPTNACRREKVYRPRSPVLMISQSSPDRLAPASPYRLTRRNCRQNGSAGEEEAEARGRAPLLNNLNRDS